ncbi:MAG: DoxX family protein [Nanoarchaeota archaeon]|mgnify:CR=1 FL=1
MKFFSYNSYIVIREEKMKKIFEKSSERLWVVFRVLVGILFFTHGGQKLLGWFGSKGTVKLFSLMGLAGIIEICVGVLLILGLFARYTALFGTMDMIGAYFYVHIKSAAFPWQNGGELALLYLVAFLAIMAKGPGMLSLDRNK